MRAGPIALCCAALLSQAAGQYNVTKPEDIPLMLSTTKLNEVSKVRSRNWIEGIVMSADDKSVYLGVGGDSALEEWDTETKTLKRALAEDFDWRAGGEVRPLQLIGADTLLVSTGYELVVEVDLRSGKVQRTYDLGALGVTQLSRYVPAAASADGRSVFAAGSYDAPKLAEFSRETGQLVKTHFEATAAVHTVAVSPDGKHVLFGGDSGVLQRLDVAAGTVADVATCGAAGGALLSAIFSRDGSALYFACEGSAVVRKLRGDGTELWSAEQDVACVRYLTETQDGKYLLSSAGEMITVPGNLGQEVLPVYQWDAATGAQVTRALTSAGKYLMLAVTSDGRRWFSGSSLTTLIEVALYPYVDECPVRLECNKDTTAWCTVYTQCNDAGQDCNDPDQDAGGNWECVCRSPQTGRRSGAPADCGQAPGTTAVAPTVTEETATGVPASSPPRPPPPTDKSATKTAEGEQTTAPPGATQVAGTTTEHVAGAGETSSGDGGEPFPWWVLGVAGGVLLAVGLAAACFVHSRRKGDVPYGEFSEMYEAVNDRDAPVQGQPLPQRMQL